MLPTAAFIEYDVRLLNTPCMFLLSLFVWLLNFQRRAMRFLICPAALQDMRDAEDACRKLDGFKGWVRGKLSIHLESRFKGNPAPAQYLCIAAGYLYARFFQVFARHTRCWQLQYLLQPVEQFFRTFCYRG